MIRSEKGARRLLLALPAILAGAAAFLPQNAAAQAQPKSEAPVRTETVVYDNWVVTCRERVEKSAKKFCTATMKVTDNKTKRDVLVWQFGQDKAGAPVFALRVPFGVQVKDGVSVTVDAGKPRKADYVSCGGRGGCEAAAPLDAAFTRELSAGKQATVTFVLANGRAVNLKVPLNGIAKALPALRG